MHGLKLLYRVIARPLVQPARSLLTLAAITWASR